MSLLEPELQTEATSRKGMLLFRGGAFRLSDSHHAEEAPARRSGGERRKAKKGGEDTTVAGQQAVSNGAIQALRPKRVQTRPADFPKVKFSCHLRTASEGAKP